MDFFSVKQFQVLLKASSELLTSTAVLLCPRDLFICKPDVLKILGICTVVSFNKENNSYSMWGMTAGWKEGQNGERHR